MIEKPDVKTPWQIINQLLAPDERFEICLKNRFVYLFAPKHSTRLVALIYALNSEEIPFEMLINKEEYQFEGIESLSKVFISVRYFNSCTVDEEGILTVGAGCSLFEISSQLFANRREIPLEELMSQNEMNLVEAIFFQKAFYLRLKKNTFVQSLLGVEGVTYDGLHLKWGGNCLGAAPGIHLHQLLLGIEKISFIPVKFFLKTYLIPEKRIHLLWTCKEKKSLVEVLKELKNFSNSWERLDIISSANPKETAFLFAQISGSGEEMSSFLKLCPYIQNAKEQNTSQLKKFFQQKKLVMIPQLHVDDSLKGEKYFWYQDLDRVLWIVTSSSKTVVEDDAIWKKRFEMSLSHGLRDG